MKVCLKAGHINTEYGCLICQAPAAEKITKVANWIESMERPIRTGRELSTTIGDLLDLLYLDGYLHDGERELLMKEIVETAMSFCRTAE